MARFMFSARINFIESYSSDRNNELDARVLFSDDEALHEKVYEFPYVSVDERGWSSTTRVDYISRVSLRKVFLSFGNKIKESIDIHRCNNLQ